MAEFRTNAHVPMCSMLPREPRATRKVGNRFKGSVPGFPLPPFPRTTLPIMPPILPTATPSRHQRHQQPFASDSRKFYFRLLLLAVTGILVLFQLLATSDDNLPLQPSTNYPPEILIAKTAAITSPTATRIPNIVHFIYGLKDPDPHLELIHYLAIKSAHDILHPTTIYLHYHHLPTGPWFARAQPYLTLRHVDLPTEIFGNPVDGYAHRADVLRIDALLQFGGIYMDLDVITLKPFDSLLDYSFVMGQEGQGGWSGLCNAVILSLPNAPFLQRWRATYRTFDQRDWNHHSVVLPKLLAPHFPEEIHVLPYIAFFWPLWDKNGLRTMFLEKSYTFEENYAVHLWESAARVNLMKGITAEVVENVDNSLYCEIRRFLREGSDGEKMAGWDEGCVVLEKTRRTDGLIGHWPLLPPPSTAPLTDPLKLPDISGNHLSGLIRQGSFARPLTATNPTLLLDGRSSYIFFPLPTRLTLMDLTVSFWLRVPRGYDKQGAVALMLHTDYIKVNLETRTTSLDNSHDISSSSVQDTLSFGIRTILFGVNNDEFSAEKLDVSPGPNPVNDGLVHHYALTMSHQRKRLTLYMDGFVVLSSMTWRLPNPEAVVRGMWLGSPEPENTQYQDPWDEQKSLEGAVRDVMVWEREMAVEEVKAVIRNGWIVDKEEEEVVEKEEEEKKMEEIEEMEEETEDVEEEEEEAMEEDAEEDAEEDEEVGMEVVGMEGGIEENGVEEGGMEEGEEGEEEEEEEEEEEGGEEGEERRRKEGLAKELEEDEGEADE